MTCNEVIKICLADSQDVFKKGLQLILEKNSSLKVVGEASNKDQLFNLVLEKRPDIIFMDVFISEGDIIPLIERIKEQNDEVRIIILSDQEEEGLISDAILAGASAFVSKHDLECEIFKAIEEVSNGNTYYSARVASKIIKLFEKKQSKRLTKRKQTFSQVEEAIINGICRELTNKEIADKLFLSVRTVEGHRLNIVRNIKAKSTAGIVIYAIKHGIYTIDWHLTSRTT